MKSIVTTNDAPGAIGPYSQATVTAGGIVFTAGQIALDPSSGELVGDDVTVQTRRVMENLRAILRAAGSDLSAVVKTTVFLRDMGDFAAMNAAYAEYFREAPPARSTVAVSKLPRDARVEIEAVALVRRG
jgi:2-iminobutanoate/2-iminopropanoate deaminase